MINAYQEQIFFHYILDNQLFLSVSKSEYFANTNIRELFDVAKEHALRYKEPPSKDQMVELLRVKGLGEKYSTEIIEGLYNTKALLSQYDDDWLEQNVGPWIQVRNLDNVMRKAIAFMKTTKVTAENASEVVEKIRHMLSSETVIDFSFNLGSDFFDAIAHQQIRLNTTSTGYDFIDKCLQGGWWRGCLIGFLAAPKAGKSTWLSNLAINSSQLGHNTAFVTLELQEELVIKRMGSNMLNIPMEDYNAQSEDQSLIKDKIQNAKQNSIIPLGALYVKEFGASTCSVTDLKIHLQKTEEIRGYKFKHVFVDYINIMKNWRNPNTENTYQKIKQIAEDLRAMAGECGWAVITATQTNRGGWDNTDLVTSNISESGGFVHTVDALFGIITDPVMHARGEFYLKCMENRVGGGRNTKKRYDVDWKYMRIDEDKNSPIQDMEYVINTVVSVNKPGQAVSPEAFAGTYMPPKDLSTELPEIKVTGSELFE